MRRRRCVGFAGICELSMTTISVDEAQRRLNTPLALLGWPATTRNWLPAEIAHDLTSLEAAYFTIGEMEQPLYLQANPQFSAHPLLLGVSIYAMRYRLCSGWHGVLLRESPTDLEAEAMLAESWLARRHFESPASRRAYREAHPECAGYNWRRIRREGPPYSQTNCALRLKQAE